MDKMNIINYILYSEAEQNVLPLSSLCHNGCVFCSHKNISKTDYLYKFYDYKRDLSEIIEHIDFLDPSKKVYIGESATKIFEGEPFLFKGIIEVLKAVRRHVKKAAICITTCGGYIARDFFDIIDEIAPVEINFSLNSYNRQTRDAIVSDNKTDETFNNLQKLSLVKNGVKLNISLMAVNEKLTPVKLLIEDSARLRALGNISIIKIFLPRFSEKQFHNFFNGYGEFSDYCAAVKAAFAAINDAPGAAPVILEPLPPDFDGGETLIHSVIPASKAAALNLRARDKIIAVNGVAPLSKTHAYQMIVSSKKKPVLAVEPFGGSVGGGPFSVSFPDYNRAKDGAGGIVFTADMPAEAIAGLIKINGRAAAEGERGIIATTALSLDYINNILVKFNITGLRAAAFTNRRFGGNIDCAGLLTLNDISGEIRGEGFINRYGGEFGIIILPSLMFDHLNYDLNGDNLNEYPALAGYKIVVV
jgi:organic radical activating enzyme